MRETRGLRARLHIGRAEGEESTIEPHTTLDPDDAPTITMMSAGEPARTAAPSDHLRLVPPASERRLAPKPLGHDERNTRRRVRLAVPDARHHTHIIGSTGSGKSTLLVNLILADARAGRGVVVLDPKGDLVTDVLARLHEGAGSRLVLIDPAETSAPPSLNVLDSHGRDPELVADQVTEVFHRLYAQWWGPRTEDVLRSACLTLARQPGTTLAHVPLLLSNETYRHSLTKRLGDVEGLGGFWSWYEQLSDAAQANVIGPVMNKLRAVLSRRFTSDLFGSATSSFSLPEVLDGGIFLCRLPKGVIGEDATRLVGSLLLAGLWQAATRRAEVPESSRLDASIYVDECQNFLHLPGSLDDVLAEARGYRVALTLAHQHLGQLPRDLGESVAANARNKVFFTLSPDDARVLARHVGPYLGPEDLAHLDRYQAACRLVANGRDTTGFTIATEPPPPITADHTAQLRADARARGRTQADRERERRGRRYAATGSTDRSSDPVKSGIARPDGRSKPDGATRRTDGRFGGPDGTPVFALDSEDETQLGAVLKTDPKGEV
jgi:hypothetical protein